MHTHIHETSDPLNSYIRTTNMRGLVLFNHPDKVLYTKKQDITVYDCLWTPYLNYTLFPNFEQLIYNFQDNLTNIYDTRIINEYYSLQKALDHKFNNNYSRFDFYSDFYEKTDIKRTTVTVIHTTQPNIELFDQCISPNGLIKRETEYEMMLITHVKHFIKIYTSIDPGSNRLDIVVLSNSINPEFLIRTTLLDTILIKKYLYPELTFSPNITEKLDQILSNAKDNPRLSLSLIYDIMDNQLDLKSYKQKQKQNLIDELNSCYKQRLIDSIKEEIETIDDNLRSSYDYTLRLTKNRRDAILRLNGLTQENESQLFNILANSPAITDISIMDKNKATLTLKVIFKVPLVNVDYAQFKRQYEKVKDIKERYYRNCQKEIKALFLDKTYSLIVQQAIRFVIDGSVVAVDVKQHTLDQSYIIANSGYPFNPHLARYNCWGDSMIQIEKYNTLDQLDDLIPVVSAAVSNLNVGDSTVMERFIEQLKELKEMTTQNKPQALCIRNNETKELITYKQFLEEIEKGDSDD